MSKRVVAVVVVGTLLTASCSSSASDVELASAPPTSAILDSRPSVSATLAPTSTNSVVPESTMPGLMTITCDADAGGNQTFDVPLGTDVTLIAVSSSEREYHLHGYDLELSGTQVTFQFTATIPGPSELTEHPGHSTVCTIVS